jgi:hypothetical protein
LESIQSSGGSLSLSGSSLPTSSHASSSTGGQTSSLASSIAAGSASSSPVVSSRSSSSISASSVSSSSLSSSSASSEGPVARSSLRFHTARIICDAEDDAGEEAEFYGVCQVTASLAGQALQAYDGGYPVSGYLWEVESSWAEEWALKPGQWKLFGRERTFNVATADLASCTFKVRAHVLENDTFSSDDLGWQELQFSGTQIPSNIAWLPTFTDGGTRARIGFMVAQE